VNAAIASPAQQGQGQRPASAQRRSIPLLGSIAIAVVIVGLAVVPPLMGGYILRAIETYLIFGMLALAVGLITGYGRLFNIGVGANFGIAAYTVAILSQYITQNPVIILIAAILAGVVVSLLFAFYALVSNGIEYLMLTFLTTLAFATIPLAFPAYTGGENGLQVKGGNVVAFGFNALEGMGFYWFVLGIVFVITLLSWFIIHSQSGKAVQAIGRNPVRAAAMGYNVSGYRVALTLFAGFVAGTGGWLYALQTSFTYGDLLGLGNSTNGLVYALIGGVDTIFGPLLGTAVMRGLTSALSRGSTDSSLYLGIVLMVVVYVMPEGVLGLWNRVWLRIRHARGQGLDEIESSPIGAAEGSGF
jgi:branched-chain amino acid transport system permease protein